MKLFFSCFVCGIIYKIEFKHRTMLVPGGANCKATDHIFCFKPAWDYFEGVTFNNGHFFFNKFQCPYPLSSFPIPF